MEAVGTLTGGIAHDFNNILTAIIGYANIIKLKIGSDDPVKLYAEQILASTERATSLTQGLLAFSRKVPINLKPVNLNEIVERVQKLLHRLISENITLKTECIDQKTTVIADSSQIEQVLMNLVTNARDAMPEGGALTISTDIVPLDNDFIKDHGYGKTGTYALIIVSDTGIGMDEKTTDRIFEPFFTTKEVGKGTGLGLSIVYGIIKQHNGFIVCKSNPGQGTTFTIYLPLVKTSIHVEKLLKAPLAKGGTETILIAEDDAEVRALTKTILKEFGYTVIEAEDGEAAVRKFMEHKDDIQILLFDVVMPIKDGKEAYKEILGIKPKIKCIFMSGYNTTSAAPKGGVEESVELLLKPLTPTILLNKIREVLDT
jgi:DNA-binding response OmpR family regulator